MKVLNEYHGNDFSLYHGDCVEVIQGLPDNSIDLTVSSLPFSTLYLYSPSLRDMGNTNDDRHFFEHFDYLIPELFRVTTPGRLCVIHCKDLPLFLGSDGVAGLRDFPAEISRRFTGEGVEYLTAKLDALTEARELLKSYDGDLAPLDCKIQDIENELLEHQQNNWTLHSKVTIWKCPKTERERTNNSGLLHSQLCKDSSASRQGMADFLLVFRKWDKNEMDGLNSTKPVTRGDLRFNSYIGSEPPLITPEFDARQYSIEVWRKYASPVWFDIDQTAVLNTEIAKENKHEPHTCPLQLGVVDRCVDLWSNPGDIVLDPFNGIGSTGVRAVKADRKYVGIELKESYWKTSIDNLEAATSFNQMKLAV